MSFQGKKVIVTGAARGIGAATALAFAAEGADVVVNDISNGEPIAEQIRAMGRKAFYHRTDVSNAAEVEALVAKAVEEFGRLDVMAANAAFSERGEFWTIPLDGFRRTLDVTMMGAYYCLFYATRQMLKQGRGNVVITSSPHATNAYPGAMPYNMAKAAVDHMVRTAACELSKKGIRVNAIHPGWTDTPGERKFATDEELERIGKTLPLGRLARPEEIARGILFLAADESEYVTGSVLAIDGGLNLPWASGT
jgi:glucose 1-dehydrogenase